MAARDPYVATVSGLAIYFRLSGTTGAPKVPFTVLEAAMLASMREAR